MKAKYYIIILFLTSLICGCIQAASASVEVKEGNCDYSLEDYSYPGNVSFSVQGNKIVINHVATYVCGGMELKADINLTGNQIFVNEGLSPYDIDGFGATSCFCPRNNTLIIGPVAGGTYDVILIYGGEEIKRFTVSI